MNNREIKFRAWVETEEGLEMEYLGAGEFDNGLWYDASKHIDGWISIMQFVGINDFTGKDIYEGDIIHSKFSDGRDCNHLIEWKESGFVARFFNDPTDYGSVFTKGWISEFKKVVIGNIYQNPELLK